MKKLIASALVSVICYSASAQYWNTSGTNIINNNTGNVGIGPSSFSFTERLTVDGNLHLANFSYGSTNVGTNAYIRITDRFTLQSTLNSSNDWSRGVIAQNFIWNNNTNKWDIPSSFSDFSAIKMENNGNISIYGNINNNVAYSLTETELQQYKRMSITGDGRVSIGNKNPGSFKLAVDGKIGAREIKVTLQDPWPDYVFQKDYKLMSLPELAEFIKQNSHLPNVPSAQEIKENEGADLGAMNVKLLEKIEELTLHLIEVNKRLEVLERENAKPKATKQ